MVRGLDKAAAVLRDDFAPPIRRARGCRRRETRKGPIWALPDVWRGGLRLARGGFGVDHPFAKERGIANAAGALAVIVLRPVLGTRERSRRVANPCGHRALRKGGMQFPD